MITQEQFKILVDAHLQKFIAIFDHAKHQLNQQTIQTAIIAYAAFGELLANFYNEKWQKNTQVKNFEEFAAKELVTLYSQAGNQFKETVLSSMETHCIIADARINFACKLHEQKNFKNTYLSIEAQLNRYVKISICCLKVFFKDNDCDEELNKLLDEYSPQAEKYMVSQLSKLIEKRTRINDLIKKINEIYNFIPYLKEYFQGIIYWSLYDEQQAEIIWTHAASLGCIYAHTLILFKKNNKQLFSIHNIFLNTIEQFIFNISLIQDSQGIKNLLYFVNSQQLIYRNLSNHGSIESLIFIRICDYILLFLKDEHIELTIEDSQYLTEILVSLQKSLTAVASGKDPKQLTNQKRQLLKSINNHLWLNKKQFYQNRSTLEHIPTTELKNLINHFENYPKLINVFHKDLKYAYTNTVLVYIKKLLKDNSLPLIEKAQELKKAIKKVEQYPEDFRKISEELTWTRSFLNAYRNSMGWFLIKDPIDSLTINQETPLANKEIFKKIISFKLRLLEAVNTYSNSDKIKTHLREYQDIQAFITATESLCHKFVCDDKDKLIYFIEKTLSNLEKRAIAQSDNLIKETFINELEEIKLEPIANESPTNCVNDKFIKITAIQEIFYPFYLEGLLYLAELQSPQASGAPIDFSTKPLFRLRNLSVSNNDSLPPIPCPLPIIKEQSGSANKKEEPFSLTLSVSGDSRSTTNQLKPTNLSESKTPKITHSPVKILPGSIRVLPNSPILLQPRLPVASAPTKDDKKTLSMKRKI